MSKLTENGLEINFVGSVGTIKFDQDDPALPEFHDIRNMPRVDFIVEMPDSIYFIEVKDPGQPNALDVGAAKFLKKVAEGTLIASLIEKYLFTFFFRWAEGCLNKSVHYISLITLEGALLQPLIDGMERQLACHFAEDSCRWNRYPLASCQVHNMETWHETFPDWPLSRIV